jgi:hypothetical protein
MSRVLKVDRDTITAQGVFHDLERNVAISDETERSIVGKRGRYNADMIVVTGNAARAIARRNAALQGIPRAFWEPIYLEARKVVAGDSKTLANRRAEALTYLQKLGVTQEMVFATLEVNGIEDITSDHLVTIRATARAIRDGEATVEEAFLDPTKKPSDPPAGSSSPGMAGLKAAVGADVSKGASQGLAASVSAPEEPAPPPSDSTPEPFFTSDDETVPEIFPDKAPTITRLKVGPLVNTADEAEFVRAAMRAAIKVAETEGGPFKQQQDRATELCALAQEEPKALLAEGAGS